MTKEEKNVFKDAKFGDKFLTRNGQIMIYQKQAHEDVYCLFDEESDCVIEYCQNGDVIYEYTGNAEPQQDDIVKKYVQPSLPSNLDEAAEEYADYNSQRWHEDGDIYYDHSKIMDAFKAGAKWMAGQMK